MGSALLIGNSPCKLITLIVVLVGVVAQYLGYSMVLLDVSLDNESINKISQLLQNKQAIKQVNHITGRNSDSYKFVQLDISLHTNSIRVAHDYAHSLEDKIKLENPFVEKVIIHYGKGSYIAIIRGKRIEGIKLKSKIKFKEFNELKITTEEVSPSGFA